MLKAVYCSCSERQEKTGTVPGRITHSQNFTIDRSQAGLKSGNVGGEPWSGTLANAHPERHEHYVSPEVHRICDNYLIGDEGVKERIHKCSERTYELDRAKVALSLRCALGGYTSGYTGGIR